MAGRHPIDRAPGIIALRASRGAAYRGVVIEDVRYEVQPLAVWFVHFKDKHAGFQSFDQGSVDGLLRRRISTAVPPRLRSLFDGNGRDTGEIRNATFENCRFGDQLLTAENVERYLERRGKTSDFRYTAHDPR